MTNCVWWDVKPCSTQLLSQHTEPLSRLSSSRLATSVGSLGSVDSSASSMQHGGDPELMVGLAYSESTGRLSVEVIKGSNFKNLATAKAPGAHPYCTLYD